MSNSKPGKHEKLEHKGREFTLEKVDPQHWQITDEAGTVYGSVAMLTKHGSDDDPVFNGYLVGHEDYTHFGSDWLGISRLLINEFDRQHPREITHY